MDGEANPWIFVVLRVFRHHLPPPATFQSRYPPRMCIANLGSFKPRDFWWHQVATNAAPNGTCTAPKGDHKKRCESVTSELRGMDLEGWEFSAWEFSCEFFKVKPPFPRANETMSHETGPIYSNHWRIKNKKNIR